MLWIGYLLLDKFKLVVGFITDESYSSKVENNFTLFVDHFEYSFLMKCRWKQSLHHEWKNLNSFLKSCMAIL